MSLAIAKFRKEIVNYGDEVVVDTSETILTATDNKDGTVSVVILSYVRKGE